LIFQIKFYNKNSIFRLATIQSNRQSQRALNSKLIHCQQRFYLPTVHRLRQYLFRDYGEHLPQYHWLQGFRHNFESLREPLAEKVRHVILKNQRTLKKHIPIY